MLSDDFQSVVQSVDLMETVDTSFGKVLSIFNLSPDIDSYERCMETSNSNQRQGRSHLFVPVSLHCVSLGIFDMGNFFDLSNKKIRRLPDTSIFFSKLENLNLNNIKNDNIDEWKQLFDTISSINLKTLNISKNKFNIVT